jgi:hypothetical protein
MPGHLPGRTVKTLVEGWLAAASLAFRVLSFYTGSFKDFNRVKADAGNEHVGQTRQKKADSVYHGIHIPKIQYLKSLGGIYTKRLEYASVFFKSSLI